MKNRALALLAGLALAPATLDAQPRPTRPDAPGLSAIVNARVVTVSGAAIESGTVVMEDGVITAVGAGVDVPAGARVIDGAGKTVYPGLIDALTTLGHGEEPEPGAARGGVGGDGDRPHAWGPEDRPGTTTWLTAADGIDPGDERFERWREAGFTSVVSTRHEGLVPGQAAVLNLGSFERPRELVVASPVAMRVNLQDRSRTYSGFPGSSMGVFAYLKQLYYDAGHHRDAWAAYEESSRGRRRPQWDGALDPIRRQLDEGWPALFPASSRSDVVRALATTAEMGVRPVVYGAQGAWEAADLLAASDVPALVSLDWPAPPRDGDPDEVPTLAELRRYDRAPTSPATLAAAGVKFAFYAGGLDDPTEALPAARRAVAQGLSADDAVRAFTLSAAEIFGVDDRLGSIETGKIANLIVTDGALFDEGTAIETVFVDGDRFDADSRGGGDEESAGSGGGGGGDEDSAESGSSEGAPRSRRAADSPGRRPRTVPRRPGDLHPRRDPPHRVVRDHRERRHPRPRRPHRGGRDRPRAARRGHGGRCFRQVRHPRHHRRPLAPRRPQHQRGLGERLVDGHHRGRHPPRGRRDVPGPRGRGHHHQRPPRLGQPHRGRQRGAQAALGRRRRRPADGRPPRHQVRARREHDPRPQPRPLSGKPHGGAGRHPPGVPRRRRLPHGARSIRGRGEEGPRPAPRPEARAARRGPARRAVGARPQLPRRRDPATAAGGRGVRGHRPHPAARPRGLQGRRRDRGPRRGRLHLLRLVGVQGRGVRRDPPQRGLDGRARSARLHQLRLGRGDPPPEPGGGQDHEVGRARRGGGVAAGDPEPRHPARHRRPGRLDGKLYFDVDLDRERQAAVEAEKQGHLEKLGLAPKKSEEDR